MRKPERGRRFKATSNDILSVTQNDALDLVFVNKINGAPGAGY